MHEDILLCDGGVSADESARYSSLSVGYFSEVEAGDASCKNNTRNDFWGTLELDSAITCFQREVERKNL